VRLQDHVIVHLDGDGGQADAIDSKAGGWFQDARSWLAHGNEVVIVGWKPSYAQTRQSHALTPARPDAARTEDHHNHQRQPEEQETVAGELAEDLGEHDDNTGSQDGPGDGAQTAKQNDAE